MPVTADFLPKAFSHTEPACLMKVLDRTSSCLHIPFKGEVKKGRAADKRLPDWGPVGSHSGLPGH